MRGKGFLGNVFLSLFICLLFVFTVPAWAKVDKAEVRARIKSISLPFIENQGQTDERVAFYAHTFSGTVFVTKKGEIVYSLPKYEGKKKGKGLKAKGEHKKKTKGWVIEESLVGASVSHVMGEERAVTRINLFRGKDPKNWKRNIPAFNLISLGEVYKGIELKLRAHGNNVEKLFYINPGIDPGKIKIKIKGAKGLRIAKDGGLDIKTPLGTVSLTRPRAYQIKDGKRQYVKVSYIVKDNEYGFKVDGYDRKRPLVIDPLFASTFLGGSDWDWATALAIGPSGNVYVAGSAGSFNFPTTPGAYDTSYNGGDVFISKLDPDLSRLLASTFLGGSDCDCAYALAIGPSGNIYVAGQTWSSDFPTTPGAYDTSYNGGDAFVSKLDPDLSRLLSSTYLGGSNWDWATALAIGPSGNVYVAGETDSSDFPTTPGAYDASYNGLDYDSVFISKLGPNLSRLIASTYLGGSGNDDANALAIGPSGNIYVAGQTWSSDFPTTPGAYDTSFNGGYCDAFVSKLSPDLSQLLASTFLGGSNWDCARALAIGPSGNVYVAGWTRSEGFPTTPGAYDTSYNGGSYDVFISKLDPNLSRLLASTYLGGSSGDEAYALALDSSGNVYVAGWTGSSDFPTTPGAYDTSYNGGDYSAFVSKLSPDLSKLLASTYLGGSDIDDALTLAIGPSGNVYVAGWTDSSDFPTTPGAYDTSGGGDAFISKLDPNLSASASINESFKPLMNPLKVTYNALDEPKYLYLYSLLKLKEATSIGAEEISKFIKVSTSSGSIDNPESKIYKKIDDKTYVIRTKVPFDPGINLYTVTLDVDKGTSLSYDVNIDYEKLCLHERSSFGPYLNEKLSASSGFKFKASLIGNTIDLHSGVEGYAGIGAKGIFVADINYCSDNDYSIALGFKQCLSSKLGVKASLLSGSISGFLAADASLAKFQVEGKGTISRVSYLEKFNQDEEPEIAWWVVPIVAYAVNPYSFTVDELTELVDEELGNSGHYKICYAGKSKLTASASAIEGGISLFATPESESESEENPPEVKGYIGKDIIQFSVLGAKGELGTDSEECHMDDSPSQYTYKKESSISSREGNFNLDFMGNDIVNPAKSVKLGFEKEGVSDYYKVYYSLGTSHKSTETIFDMSSDEFQDVFPDEELKFTKETFQRLLNPENPRICSTKTINDHKIQFPLIGLELQADLGLGGEIGIEGHSNLKVPSTPVIAYSSQMFPIYEEGENGTGGSSGGGSGGGGGGGWAFNPNSTYAGRILKKSIKDNWDSISNEITSFAKKALFGIEAGIKKAGEAAGGVANFVYKNGKKAATLIADTTETIKSVAVNFFSTAYSRAPEEETAIVPLVYSHNLKFLSPVMVLGNKEEANETKEITAVLYPTEENVELAKEGGVYTFVGGKWTPVKSEPTEDNGFKFEASVPGIYALILPFPDDEGFMPQIVNMNPGEEKTINSFSIKMSDGSKAKNQEFQLKLTNGFTIKEDGTTTFGSCPVTFPSSLTTDEDGRLKLQLSADNKEGECFIKINSKSGYAQQIIRVIVSNTIKADPNFYLGIKLAKPESGIPKIGDKITLKAIAPYEPKEINWTIKDSSGNEVATGNSTEISFAPSKSDVYKVYCYAKDKNGVLRNTYGEVPVSDPNNDTDKDGISDNIEKYFGTNPDKADSQKLLKQAANQSNSIIEITEGQGYIVSSEAVPLDKLENIPANVEPKYALSFRIGGLGKGRQVTLKITTPLKEEENYHVFKVKNGKWIDITNDVEIKGNIITYLVSDGGKFDEDNTKNGQIDDPIVIATLGENGNGGSSGGGGGGCSLNPNASFDPTMLFLMLIVLIAYAIKRRSIKR